MRKFYLLSCIFLSIVARENPFIATGDLNTSVKTTNIKEEYENFERQNVKFPSDASLLLNIKVQYRATDGSMKEKTIDINKTINPRNEYALIKLNDPKPQVTPKLDVSVTMPENSVIKEVIVDTNTTNAKIMPSSAPVIGVVKEEIGEKIPDKKQVITDANTSNNIEINIPIKSVKFKDFIRFDVGDEKTLRILTSDKLVKHFIYEKKQIVIDLKEQKSFKTDTLSIDTKFFKNIRLGWHKGRYRAVITLDKAHKYELVKLSDNQGYEIKLNN